MSGLTLSDLKTRVAVNLQDVDTSGVPTYTMWKETWIANWVNDAIAEVCSEVQLLKQYTTFGANPVPVITSNATAEYVPVPSASGIDSPITPDYQNMDQIVFLQAGINILDQITVTQAAEMFNDWDTRTGTPRWYIFNDLAPGVVKLIPDPDETLTTVRGVATLKPALLTSATAQPPFDSQYHVLCEYYATARALLMEGETRDDAGAARWDARYQVKLQQLKRKQSRNFSQGQRVVDWDAF
jgi:hypothetical protein